MSHHYLYLIRHGESAWNAESRLQGQGDPVLSEKGREQAGEVAAIVSELEAEHAIVSGLARASETAQLAGHGDAEVDPRWNERNLGDWQGQLEDDIPEADMTAFRDNEFVPAGAESWEEFQARVAGAFEDLAERGGSWLVFTHGGCVRAVVSHLTGADVLTVAGPSNTSVSIVQIAPRRRLRAFNRTTSPGLERPSEPGA